MNLFVLFVLDDVHLALNIINDITLEQKMFHQNFGGGFGNDDMGPGRIGFLDFIFSILFSFLNFKHFNFWN